MNRFEVEAGGKVVIPRQQRPGVIEFVDPVLAASQTAIAYSRVTGGRHGRTPPEIRILIGAANSYLLIERNEVAVHVVLVNVIQTVSQVSNHLRCVDERRTGGKNISDNWIVPAKTGNSGGSASSGKRFTNNVAVVQMPRIDGVFSDV